MPNDKVDFRPLTVDVLRMAINDVISRKSDYSKADWDHLFININYAMWFTVRSSDFTALKCEYILLYLEHFLDCDFYTMLNYIDGKLYEMNYWEETK